MTRLEAPELCPRCGELIVQFPLGRRRKWCSDYCRRRRRSRGLRDRYAVVSPPMLPAPVGSANRIEKLLTDLDQPLDNADDTLIEDRVDKPSKERP
ncbi:hypothetical protein [Nocardia farcinica]